MKTILIATTLTLLLAQAPAARAHGSEASSALSLLPVAVSVAAPVIVVSGAASLAVVAVESTAQGTVWVLERASDGARMSVRFTGKVVEGSALSVGATVLVTAMASGYVLSAAGKAIAFIPNEIGASLLYNERITLR